MSCPPPLPQCSGPRRAPRLPALDSGAGLCLASLGPESPGAFPGSELALTRSSLPTLVMGAEATSVPSGFCALMGGPVGGVPRGHGSGICGG